MIEDRVDVEPRFRVLGAVSIAAAGAADSPRLRRLVAGLLIHAGSVVPVDRLADIVWADAPPDNVDNALQSLISRLRTALRAAGISTAGRQTPLVTRSPGYVLTLDTDDLDAHQFERLVGAARASPPDGAAVMLEQALGLWRGPAYAEFADAGFARAEAVRLEELRATARGEYAHALLDLGRHDEAIARLEALTADRPLSERPHEQLMLALHRAGRTPDALAVFRRMRRRLTDELGIEPGTALQDLHTRLLRRDADLESRGAAPIITRSPQPRRPGNIPAAVTELIGRDAAMARVREMLRATRLVTLTGPGGVGKTTLALALARDLAGTYPDGAWVFELGSIARPGDVADLVTSTLDLTQHEATSTLDQLTTALRARRALMVVDNCEHVIDGAATMIDALLRSCPDIVVLATSRQALGLSGERLWPVPPLALTPGATGGLSPAMRLFAQRARAAAPAFALTDDNAEDVRELCRRLDGLPLAIELAAMRMPAMTAAEVVERLPIRLRFLRSTSRFAEERHRTLRAVVDWSYDALEPDERRWFETVSVFAGSFTAAAAEQVAERCGLDPADAIDVLGRLVDTSLVTARPERPATRYSLLETLRDYGQQRLADRSALEHTQAAHAAHWLAFAERMSTRLFTREQNAAVDALAREMAELRSAHNWALRNDLARALRLVATLIGYAELRLPPELFGWAQHTVAAAQERGVTSPDVATAHALVAAGARVAGDLAAARSHAAHALGHDPGDAAFAHHHAVLVLSDVSLFEGRLADVHALERRRRALPDAPDTRWVEVQSMMNEALAYAYGGDADAALEVVDTVRAALTEDDAPFFAAYPAFAAGEALMERDPVRASTVLEEALSAARRGRDRLVLGVVMVSVASLHLRLDDPGRALALFRTAVAHWRQLGVRTMLWTTLRTVVALLSSLDATTDASVLLGVITTRATAAPVYGADRERLETVEAVLRARLGEASFEQARARGAAMTDDEAIGFAETALARAEG
jgi:predicted ATPase/DNA-binding SARP family transcriptional activator